MKNNTSKILLALLVVMTLLVGLTTLTVNAADDTAASEEGYVTIYFENNWLWSDVSCHYWGSATGADTEWPGVAMTKAGTLDGHDVYSASVPTDVSGLSITGIKNDGSGNLDQTPDITEGIVDGAGWKMLWVDGNQVESITYDPSNPDASSPDTGSDSVSDGVYTVAGVTALCGSEWNVGDTYNDMTYNAETGLYEKTFTGIPAGSYECKVAANHSWDQSWGTADNGEYGNYSFTTFDEHDITITFNPTTQEVKHTLAESTGPDENRPASGTTSTDFESCGKITVYVADSANWGNVKVHAWVENASGDIAYTTWPGLDMEWDSDNLLYYIELPEICDSVVFNNGSGTQSADLVIPGEDAIFDNVTNMWTDFNNYVPPILPEDTVEDVTVYVKDDAGWGDVYIYYWNVSGIEACSFPGVPMYLGDDGYYYATIPAGFCSVIFSNGGSWEDGSLLQTPDLLIPTDGKVYLSNGNSYLYNEGVADDNNAWYALGNTPDTNDPGTDEPGTDAPGTDDSGTDEPAPQMTFLQKMAKALLLFLRSIEDFFKGIFKK